MKKGIIIGLVILSVLAAIFFISRGVMAKNQAQLLENLETTIIEKGTLYTTVGAAGRVRSNQSALLAWAVPGQVEQVIADVGTTVAAGDLIASLEQTSLPPYVILARADLVNAQKDLGDLLTSPVQQANALKAIDAAENALEDANNPEVAQAEAKTAIAQANEKLLEAQRYYDITTAIAPQSAIERAYGSILLAENKQKETLELIANLQWKYTSAGAGLPPFLSGFKIDIRRGLKKALEGLELQRVQEQIALDNARARYNNLLEPPDPKDVMIAEAALFAAKAQVNDAQRQWERIKDGTSPAEIAVLEAKLADARREWERVKDGPNADDISILETQITAALAALNQTRITAPFDGVITEVALKPGDQVEIGNFAVRVDDISRLLVDVDVSEVDINRIEIGQDVILNFESVVAKNYNGKVEDIAIVGTNLTGIVVFNVTIEILDVDEYIRPGMKAEASIILNQKEDVLLVPNRAIRVFEGERVVYIVDKSFFGFINQDSIRVESQTQRGQPPINIHPVPVTLGDSSNEYSEILSGEINPGDVVVINPSEEIIAIAQGQNRP